MVKNCMHLHYTRWFFFYTCLFYSHCPRAKVAPPGGSVWIVLFFCDKRWDSSIVGLYGSPRVWGMSLKWKRCKKPACHECFWMGVWMEDEWLNEWRSWLFNHKPHTSLWNISKSRVKCHTQSLYIGVKWIWLTLFHLHRPDSCTGFCRTCLCTDSHQRLLSCRTWPQKTDCSEIPVLLLHCAVKRRSGAEDWSLQMTQVYHRGPFRCERVKWILCSR